MMMTTAAANGIGQRRAGAARKSVLAVYPLGR
jgi:hypothetical protein